MTSLRSALWQAARTAILGCTVWAASGVSAAAQETVTITVPSSVSFAVHDVRFSTSGWPSSTRLGLSSASLLPGKTLRVSVQADAAALTPPSGAGIPVSKVTWTSVGESGGRGWGGTLTSSSYTLVFESNPNPTSGYVNLAWTLAAPGSGIRAGVHQLTIRWKVESITP